MGTTIVKLAISFIALFAYATPAFAQTDPIQLLIDSVGLDLSNPNATRTRDKEFRSNDPTVKARIYKLPSGIKVKLVGQNFSKSSEIDKIRVVYNVDELSFKKAELLLTQNYGMPSNKRPQLNVWRTENPTRSSRQAKQVKIISIDKDSERWVITADRQKGGIGNNPRSKQQITKTVIQSQKQTVVNRQYERD